MNFYQLKTVHPESFSAWGKAPSDVARISEKMGAITLDTRRYNPESKLFSKVQHIGWYFRCFGCFGMKPHSVCLFQHPFYASYGRLGRFEDRLMLMVFRLYRIRIIVIVHDIGHWRKLVAEDEFNNEAAFLAKYVDCLIVHNASMRRRLALEGVPDEKMIELGMFDYLIEGDKAIHCTGEGEVDAVRHLGIATPTFIAPLGCHLPQWPVQRVVAENKTLLFLSRISEEKGLVYLLDAWKSIPHDGWRFVVAGPDWRGYKRTLEEKISADSIDAVEFVGAADATLKDRLYRQADAFVLPSPMENFSMVVLDALAYGLPVVCTKGTPWRAIQENCCGWWIEPKSSSALADALMSVMNLSLSDVQKVRENARRLAERYSWDLISKGVLANYE